MLKSQLDRFSTSYVSKSGEKEIILPLWLYDRLVSAAIKTIKIDELWYNELNKDVAAAIDAGAFKTAQEHYASAGWYENRLPFPIVVDETFYFNTYKDVHKAVQESTMQSAQKHFETIGRIEGRLPKADYFLF